MLPLKFVVSLWLGQWMFMHQPDEKGCRCINGLILKEISGRNLANCLIVSLFFLHSLKNFLILVCLISNLSSSLFLWNIEMKANANFPAGALKPWPANVLFVIFQITVFVLKQWTKWCNAHNNSSHFVHYELVFSGFSFNNI